MKARAFADKASGLLLCAMTVLVICNEWGVAKWSEPLKLVLVLSLVAILTSQVRLSRKAFVLVGLILSIALAVTNRDWLDIVVKA